MYYSSVGAMTDSAAIRPAADDDIDDRRDPRTASIPTIKRSPVASGHVDSSHDAPLHVITATAGDAIALGPTQGLAPWDLERLQQQLNSSTQTSSSEVQKTVSDKCLF